LFFDPDEMFIKHLRRLGVKIGDHVQIVDRYKFKYEPWNANLIELSDGVIIAAGVRFVTHDSAYANVFSGLPTKMGKIVIGKNSYVGVETIILPGVSIGESCIIGAGSLVTKDISSFSVAVGNPAGVIGDTREGCCKFKDHVSSNSNANIFYIDFGGSFKQISEKHGRNASSAIMEQYRDYFIKNLKNTDAKAGK
jgi:acyl-[acyl carrier protein]--UDP-N-acetylglucosamine O-acyltransferase